MIDRLDSYVVKILGVDSLQRGLRSRTCTRTQRSRSQRRKDGSFFSCLFTFDFCVLICKIVLNLGFRIKVMYHHVNERSGLKAPLIADDVYEIIMKVIFFTCSNIIHYLILARTVVS